MDPKFTVRVIDQTTFPQRTIWAAMHQDYAESFVAQERENWPTEARAGEIAVKRLLDGGRGHWGPLEHPQITMNIGWFPHSTMQQIRTHRVGVSFDVQSFRYTGQRIIEVANGDRDIEDVFYFRPCGFYQDRSGKKYEYTIEHLYSDRGRCAAAANHYRTRISQGFSEEHARDMIPFNIRQHWVLSANVRSLCHLLDLRWKADAQLEAQQLCDLIWPHFKEWVPNIADWYEKNRMHKARLAP